LTDQELIYRLGYLYKQRAQTNFDIKAIENIIKQRSSEVEEDVKRSDGKTIATVTNKIKGGIFDEYTSK